MSVAPSNLTSDELMAAGVKLFIRRESRSAAVRARDRADGTRIFLRLNDGERLDLLSELIDAWLDDICLNEAMLAGLLRQAWDSEPYINGVRLGSYVSAVAARTPGGAIWTIYEFLETWGAAMMTPSENSRLEGLTFPLTVYRGGAGGRDDIAAGTSWTLNPETARFYAETWPKRWGDTRPPLVLSLIVERDEVVALLDDRGEDEMLLDRPCYRYAEMEMVSFDQGSPAKSQ